MSVGSVEVPVPSDLSEVPAADPAEEDAGADGADRADRAETEMASRLRLAVTRLHRRLRQHAPSGLSQSQSSALASIDKLGSPTLGALPPASRSSRRR